MGTRVEHIFPRMPPRQAVEPPSASDTTSVAGGVISSTATMPRPILLQDMPKFQGFDTQLAIPDWFTLYELKCAAISQGPAESFALHCADAILLELTRKNTAFTTANWSRIRQELTTTYHITVTSEVHEREYQHTVQQPGENVKRFAYKLQEAGARTGRHADQCINQFRAGLNSEIGQYLLAHSFRTLNEAVQTAIGTEENIKTAKATMPILIQQTTQTPAPAPVAVVRHDEEIATINAMQPRQFDKTRLSNQPSYNSNQYVRSRRVQCFFCGELGHVQRECKRRRRGDRRRQHNDSTPNNNYFTVIKGTALGPAMVITIAVGRATADALIDTGATATFIRQDVLSKVGEHQLQEPSQRRFTGGNGQDK